MASEADKYRIDSDMSVAELDELIKNATEQKAKAKKKEKAKAIQTVKELITTYEIIKLNKKITRSEIREMISGNYCRCTGYQAIVDAIEDSINKLNAGA